MQPEVLQIEDDYWRFEKTILEKDVYERKDWSILWSMNNRACMEHGWCPSPPTPLKTGCSRLAPRTNSLTAMLVLCVEPRAQW